MPIRTDFSLIARLRPLAVLLPRLSASSLSLAATLYPTACAIAQYEMLSAHHEMSNSPKQEALKQAQQASNATLSDCLRNIGSQLSADSASHLKTANDGMNNDLAYNLGII